MANAFVLGGVRTPVGHYGRSQAHVRVDDLLGQTMVAACERVRVALDRVSGRLAAEIHPVEVPGGGGQSVTCWCRIGGAGGIRS